MLKIKSKAILAFTGLMVAAFVFVGAFSASADMVTLPSTGVSKSSGMSNIQALQTFLNWTLGSQITPLVVDGVYGAKTTAAIKLFQSQNGLSADGAFGKLSSAKAMALQANAGGVTYPAGCTSNTGFSSTSGMSCAGGALPAGCTSSAGFSSTTGLACSTSVGGTLPAGCTSMAGFSITTGMPCGGTVQTGTNGYLSDIASDSTNRVSTVYESEQDKVVAGFRATARLASQTVNRVRVTFRNTDTSGSSVSLSKYASGVSLWYGSTKLATMSVAQADRSTTDDTYTFNFSGLSAMIAQDQIGRFYVSINVNGSIDTGDATDDWTVAFPTGGVMATSPDGSTDNYDAAVGNVTGTDGSSGLGFGKFSANGVKATVGLSASNPTASVVAVQNTTVTNNVDLLKFTIKATNSDLTLRRIPIQVVSSSGAVSLKINTLRLYNGTQLLASVDGSSGYTVSAGATTTTGQTPGTTTTVGYVFNSLSSPGNVISSGQTAEFTIQADLKQVSGNYTEGQTLQASFANGDAILVANFSVDANGDQLTAGSTYRVGSAVGTVFTLRSNGAIVDLVSTSADGGISNTSGEIISRTVTSVVTVKALNEDVYIGRPLADSTTIPAVVAVASAVAGTDVVTSGTHSLVVGDGVVFTSLSAAVGITANTQYYVLTVPSSTTFTLSATPGGATLDITATFTANMQRLVGFAFNVKNASSGVAQTTGTVVTSASMSSNDATLNGNVYRVGSGLTKTFTIVFTYTGTTTEVTKQYRVVLNQVLPFTEGSAPSAQTLSPSSEFETPGYTITETGI